MLPDGFTWPYIHRGIYVSGDEAMRVKLNVWHPGFTPDVAQDLARHVAYQLRALDVELPIACSHTTLLVGQRKGSFGVAPLFWSNTVREFMHLNGERIRWYDGSPLGVRIDPRDSLHIYRVDVTSTSEGVVVIPQASELWGENDIRLLRRVLKARGSVVQCTAAWLAVAAPGGMVTAPWLKELLLAIRGEGPCRGSNLALVTALPE